MLKHLIGVLKSYSSLRSGKATEEAALAWACMTSNMSYRLGRNAEDQPTIGLRTVWRTWRKMNSVGTCLTVLNEGPGFAIFDGDFRYQSLEHTYVTRQSTAPISAFVSKTDLPYQFKGHYLAQFVWLMFSLRFVAQCMVSRKSRVQFALHPVFIAELTALSKVIDAHSIEGIYDFSPYFIDSNWTYVFLRHQLSEYIKLPSPGPLKTHNHTLLCDTLIVSSGYHEEELPHLPDVRYKKLEKWLPEWAFTYIDRYLNHPSVPPPQSIGFYSHGSWLRTMEGHSDDNLSIDKSEAQLLNDLQHFLTENRAYSLTIFLHPRERKLSPEQCLEHYRTHLGSVEFKFADNEVPSTQAFEQVEIGVAAFSTILYERLFCGYKTLIGNYFTPGFPIEGSALAPICFGNREALFAALHSCGETSTSEFFAQPGMSRYHYKSYPYFKHHGSDH